MDIQQYLKTKKAEVDEALLGYLAASREYSETLYKSVHYSMVAGGKRLRPILTLAAAEVVGGNAKIAMPVACALEMIHTFSLIHDDLPGMDDDDLRRGAPTNHKVFGEGIAILAGDALLAEAFSCLTHVECLNGISPSLLLEVIRDIAEASGPRGMVGGQVVDLESEGKNLDVRSLEELHQFKTGKMITVSVTSGAKIGGADPAQIACFKRYGDAIGLAFQIVNDIHGVEGSPEELGKAVGSDERLKKATFPAIAGMKQSKERAASLISEALEALASFGPSADPLRGIASYIIERRN